MDRRLPGWLLPAAGIGLPLLAVLVAILVLEPYYGVVDDAILLGYAQVAATDFPGEWADRVWSDISSWGMVRPFYWALAYGEYSAGADSPTALYLVNWAATGAVLAFAGYAISPGVPRRARPRSGSSSRYTERRSSSTRGRSISSRSRATRRSGSCSPRRSGCSGSRSRGSACRRGSGMRPAPLVIVLGATTKAQFVVFLPAFCLLVLDHRREGRASWWRVAGVTALGGTAALALRVVAWHGDYTEGFGLSNVLDQLGSAVPLARRGLRARVNGVHVRAAQAACSETSSRRPSSLPLSSSSRSGREASSGPSSDSWPRAPSRLPSGVFAPPALATAALVASLVWACTWIVVRTDELYSSLTSIGEFARSAPARALAADGTPVYISCEEGSVGHRRLRAPRAG